MKYYAVKERFERGNKTEEDITAECITEKHITEKHITGSVSRGTLDHRWIGKVIMECRAFHVKHYCGQAVKGRKEVIRR